MSAGLEASTVTPGSTPPDESRTMPAMPLAPVWARISAGAPSPQATTVSAHHSLIDVMVPPTARANPLTANRSKGRSLERGQSTANTQIQLESRRRSRTIVRRIGGRDEEAWEHVPAGGRSVRRHVRFVRAPAIAGGRGAIRRMARLRRRQGLHQVLAARSDQRLQRPQPP